MDTVEDIQDQLLYELKGYNSCIPNNIYFILPLEVKRRSIHQKSTKRTYSPNIFVSVPRGGYHGMYIMIKIGNVIRQEELRLEKLKKNGYFIAIVYNYENGLQLIKKYYEMGKTND